MVAKIWLEEAKKRKLMIVGALHTHPESEVKPSHWDRISWLTLMFEFDRPLGYFIINPNSLKLAGYTIPSQVFIQLKEAIKLVNDQVEN